MVAGVVADFRLPLHHSGSVQQPADWEQQAQVQTQLVVHHPRRMLLGLAGRAAGLVWPVEVVGAGV
jgi:hypothetical protein